MQFATIHDGIDVGMMFFEDNEFARTFIWESCEQPSAHDSGVIEDDQVTSLDKIIKVGIMAVGDVASLAVKHEQASAAADFWRMLGNTFLGEAIIKIRY